MIITAVNRETCCLDISSGELIRWIPSRLCCLVGVSVAVPARGRRRIELDRHCLVPNRLLRYPQARMKI